MRKTEHDGGTQRIIGLVAAVALAAALIVWMGWTVFGWGKLRPITMSAPRGEAAKSTAIIAALPVTPATTQEVREVLENAAKVSCPLLQYAAINRDKPDKTMLDEVTPRTFEAFGLLKFDLSRFSTPPRKAIFRASVYYIERTKEQPRPARLVFHRVKTDWDQSVTFRYAKSASQARWAEGFFSPSSSKDIDPSPVAVVEVPNPPPGGYNVQFDITKLVGQWASGEYPNCGLMVRVEQGPTYSYQANFLTRKHSWTQLPTIVCVPEGP